MTASPIKVSADTKEQVRIAAALLKCSQADLVGRAVSEYTARHSDALRAGIADAGAALALGGDAAIAYCSTARSRRRSTSQAATPATSSAAATTAAIHRVEPPPDSPEETGRRFR